MIVKNQVFSSQKTTIFTIMSAMANDFDAINLGQGFPDDDGPLKLREAAAHYLIEGPNQYPPMMGIPELRQAVAQHNSRFYDLEVDWKSQILITSGATEALAACFMGLLNPGDEVLVFEPVYDSYPPMIESMGAKVVPISLKAPDWSFSEEHLRKAISERTKMIVLNSPMNPVGKVFSQSELRAIAEVAIQFDLAVICDEVYEHLTFDDQSHHPLITLPGMENRCIRIGSAGKTFSLTGWKVGYATGSADLISAVGKAHQFLTFTTPNALQSAVADGLAFDDDYFESLKSSMASKRDLLASGLSEIGFQVLPSAGTYFLVADFSKIGRYQSDMAFCETITEKARVAAIPISAFYQDQSRAPHTLVRFCFCKNDEILNEAIARLRNFFAP